MSMSVSDGRVSRSLQSLSFIHPSVVLTEYSQLTFFNERFFVKLSINNHIVGLVHKNRIIRTCLMYHAACKVEFQPFARSYSQLTFFNFLIKKNCKKSKVSNPTVFAGRANPRRWGRAGPGRPRLAQPAPGPAGAIFKSRAQARPGL